MQDSIFRSYELVVYCAIRKKYQCYIRSHNHNLISGPFGPSSNRQFYISKVRMRILSLEFTLTLTLISSPELLTMLLAAIFKIAMFNLNMAV